MGWISIILQLLLIILLSCAVMELVKIRKKLDVK